MKYLDAETLVGNGYLQEVNRGFFHPHGLALAVAANGTLCIWDCRDDPEGIRFKGTDLLEKAERLREIATQRRATRVAALGYWQQPESDPEILTERDALRAEWDKLRKAAENVTLTAEARYTVGGRDHGKQVYSVVMKVYLDELRAALAKEGE